VAEKSVIVRERDDYDYAIDLAIQSAMMVAVMMMVLSSMPVFQQVQNYLQTQQYEGLTANRNLQANDSTHWENLTSNPPYVPWITASFYNEGPDTAFLSLNYPDNAVPLKAKETWNVGFTGANRRLEVIFYKTDPGKSALVRVVGKY
jgi:hypothetical protein